MALGALLPSSIPRRMLAVCRETLSSILDRAKHSEKFADRLDRVQSTPAAIISRSLSFAKNEQLVDDYSIVSPKIANVVFNATSVSSSFFFFFARKTHRLRKSRGRAGRWGGPLPIAARYRGISGYRVSDVQKFFGLARRREKLGLTQGRKVKGVSKRDVARGVFRAS